MSREGSEIYKSTGEFTVDSGGNTAGSQSNDGGNVPAGNLDPTMVAINKAVKAGVLEYKVISSRTLKTGRIFAPKESGNHFVLINIEIKNTSDQTFETQYGGLWLCRCSH